MSDTQEASAPRAPTAQELDDLQRICNHLRSRGMQPDMPLDLFPLFQQLDEIRRNLAGED